MNRVELNRVHPTPPKPNPHPLVSLPTLSPLAPLRGEGPGVRGYRKEKDSNPQAKPIILGSSARIPYRLYRFPLGSLLRVSAPPREPIAAVKPHQPGLRPNRLIDGRR